MGKNVQADKEVSLKTALLILGVTLLTIISAGMFLGYKFIWYQVNQITLGDQRLRAAQESARQNPQDSGKIAAVGEEYLRQGNLDRALIEYEKAHLLDPKESAIKFNLGVVYKEKKDYQKAISLLSVVVRENPRHYLGQVNIGVVYREKGNHREAIHAFNKALAINPGAADVYLLMGETNEQMGKKEEALKNVNMALRFVPGYGEALAAKKRITQPR